MCYLGAALMNAKSDLVNADAILSSYENVCIFLMIVFS